LQDRLSHGVNNRNFLVVAGDAGCGKTTAIRHFMSGLDPSRTVALYISEFNLTPRNFYFDLLNQLGIKPHFYRGDAKRQLVKEILALSDDHKLPVIIIDEAHMLSPAMLEETRFLLNNSMDSKNPMCLVIVGQNELKERLSEETYEPITQRIDFRFALAPFDRAQTQDYIHSHMRYAGETRDIFSPSAIDAVYGYSGGVARKINKVCSLSLLYASQKTMHTIDGGIIDFVVNEELTW
jgi:type II secretory pathway predicted ATPase ExeA